MTNRLQLVTADTAYPLKLSEVKDHLGITLADDDNRLMGYLQAATAWAENAVRGGIATMSQTWDLFMPDFPGGENSRGRVDLPTPPLQSVTHVKYYDTDNTLQTLTVTTDYVVQTDYRRGGWVVPAADTYWPTVKDQRDDGVQIRFIAGHSTRALVPPNIKQAMLMTIAHWNENRESVITGTSAAEVPQSATMLITQSEVGSYA